MRTLARISLCAVAALLIATPASAYVRVGVDVLWDPNPDDDVQVFLHASNVAYPMPRDRVVPVWREMRHPHDDYPVLAFIAHHGRADIGIVWSYRSKGHSWFQTMVHFGVRPSLLFVDLSEPPGPPYGKAWGHWKKHGNRVQPRYVHDRDVRFWVQTRAVSIYVGSSPSTVYGWHKSGKKYERIAAEYHHKKHPVHGKAGPPGKAKGHGRGKGHGKGHGKDRD